MTNDKKARISRTNNNARLSWSEAVARSHEPASWTVRMKMYPKVEGHITHYVSETEVSVVWKHGISIMNVFPLESLEPTPYGWRVFFEATNDADETEGMR